MDQLYWKNVRSDGHWFKTHTNPSATVEPLSEILNTQLLKIVFEGLVVKVQD